jgi:exonuclease III
MRLVTWNINGLKAVVSKYGSTQKLLDSLEAGACQAAVMAAVCHGMYASSGIRSAQQQGCACCSTNINFSADIVCFQETKLQRNELQRELALVEGW